MCFFCHNYLVSFFPVRRLFIQTLGFGDEEPNERDTLPIGGTWDNCISLVQSHRTPVVIRVALASRDRMCRAPRVADLDPPPAFVADSMRTFAIQSSILCDRLALEREIATPLATTAIMHATVVHRR